MYPITATRFHHCVRLDDICLTTGDTSEYRCVDTSVYLSEIEASGYTSVIGDVDSVTDVILCYTSSYCGGHVDDCGTHAIEV